MAIYAEKRNGKATGRIVVEVGSGANRKRTFTRDPREAKRIEKEMLLGAWEKPADETPQGYTLGRLFSDTVAELWRGNKDEGQSQKRLEVCIDLLGRDLLLSDLRTKHIDALVKALRAKPALRGRHAQTKGAAKVAKHRDKARGGEAPKTKTLSGATINRHLASLSKALEWASKRAEDTGFIQRVHLDWQEDAKKREEWITLEEEDRVVSWLFDEGERTAALVVRVLCATGLRIGELLALDASDIEEDSVILKDTKNGTREAMPLAAPLCDHLRSLLETEGMPTYWYCLSRLRRALKATGIEPKMGLHGLRHSVGTRLQAEGVDLSATAMVLRHKSTKVTERYRHLNLLEKKRALARIARPSEAEA